MKAQTIFNKFLQALRPVQCFSEQQARYTWMYATYCARQGRTRLEASIAESKAEAQRALLGPEVVRACAAAMSVIGDLKPWQRLFVQRLHETIRRLRYESPDFVQRFDDAANGAVREWQTARTAEQISPEWIRATDTMIDFVRQRIRLRGGTSDSDIGALVSADQPGMTTERLRQLWTALQRGLNPIVDQIPQFDYADLSAGLSGFFPVDQQRALGQRTLQLGGFNRQAGDLDLTWYRSCVVYMPGNTRVLVQFNPRNLATGLRATLHERGHGFFREGWRRNLLPYPYNLLISGAIDEGMASFSSDILVWNQGFWNRLFESREFRPFRSLPREALQRCCSLFLNPNPGAADVFHYPFYVAMVGDLEDKMLRGTITARELPDAFGAAMQRIRGKKPPNLKAGVLRMWSHWPKGNFAGHWPYLYGPAVAAQWYAALRQDPTVAAAIDGGDIRPALRWLRANVCPDGAYDDLDGMLIRTTRKPLGVEDLINHYREVASSHLGLRVAA